MRALHLRESLCYLLNGNDIYPIIPNSEINFIQTFNISSIEENLKE